MSPPFPSWWWWPERTLVTRGLLRRLEPVMQTDAQRLAGDSATLSVFLSLHDLLKHGSTYWLDYGHDNIGRFGRFAV